MSGVIVLTDLEQRQTLTLATKARSARRLLYATVATIATGGICGEGSVAGDSARIIYTLYLNPSTSEMKLGHAFRQSVTSRFRVDLALFNSRIGHDSFLGVSSCRALDGYSSLWR